MRAHALVLLVAASTVAVLAVPLAKASCPIHLEVQGRQPLFAPPPTMGASGGACASAPIVGQLDAAVLLSGTDAIMVHFHLDHGAGVPTLAGTLDGSGLANVSITLQRTPEAVGGGYHYALPSWLPLPAPATSGTLTAAADGETATYRVRP